MEAAHLGGFFAPFAVIWTNNPPKIHKKKTKALKSGDNPYIILGLFEIFAPFWERYYKRKV